MEEPPDRIADGSGLTGARVGAIFTAVILWRILVAAAATLGRHHQAVTSAQDGAAALRPLAGSAAAGLFAAGLITSAVIALPVLMPPPPTWSVRTLTGAAGCPSGSAAPGASTRS